MKSKFKIGISQGDINGIGYEVILKALANPAICEICTPIIYGSAKAASYHKKNLGIDSYTITVARSADEANIHKVNLINTSNEEPKVEFGHASPEAGHSALNALNAATNDLINNKIDALVTGPINKATIQSADFKFPGHTEYLEHNLEGKALMILADDSLRVALLTTHLPISRVAQNVTKDAIVNKLSTLNDALKSDFGIIRPRIAVLALNPHAGDNGLLGTEEIEIITPAIAESCAKGIVAVGPYAADGFFGTGAYKNFDAVLAMYHDQGLAAFKAIAADRGVNITCGLNRVRTSPAHGTAYDIAGKNIADPTSMRNAIFQAIDILNNRTRYAQMNENPLPYPKNEERNRSKQQDSTPHKQDNAD